jgi:phosphoribosyl 1,2-cyclic phosphate phosphodiesterase
VPVIGCPCPTCTSTNARNKRTRASVYVETDEGVHLLIDTGPEVRLQSLREGVTHVDAVLYTHFHADHTAGIDDLKAFNAALGGILPCFGDAPTGASLRERFAYAFDGTPWVDRSRTSATRRHVAPFYLGGDVRSAIRAAWLDPRHGHRIGGFAYLTDTSGVPSASRALLRDLDVVVIDALRWSRTRRT